MIALSLNHDDFPTKDESFFVLYNSSRTQRAKLDVSVFLEYFTI
jgi:hypothetical protein